MFRKLLLPIICLLCFSLPVAAQDVPTPEDFATNTPVVVVTEAPPDVTPAPILTPDNAISVSTLIYGLIIAILGGGTVGLVINRFGDNKANLDAAEKLFVSLSPDAQTNIRQMFEAVQAINVRLLEIVDKVTDGKPNEPVG